MGIKTSQLPDGIALIEITGSLLGGKEIDGFRTAVTRVLMDEKKKLIIDISGITFINSAAVGVLVSAFISYSRKGWELRLAGINNAVYTILKVTKLNLALESHDTREEAIESFD